MSTGRLNVWVTERVRPDRIRETESFVHVLHMDGTLLTWCGTTYTDLRTECGHVEIEVPPGCYAICATESVVAGEENLGNHLTHIAIVNIGCHERACIVLFNPTLHHCRTWFESAVFQAVEVGRITAETGQLFEAAFARFREEVPADPFTEAMEPLLRGGR